MSNNIININTGKKQNAQKISCPTCQKEVLWNDTYPFRPFCCKRCKLIDLGEWASESHRIPGDDTPSLSDDDF